MTATDTWRPGPAVIRAAAEAIASVDPHMTRSLAAEVLTRSLSPEYGRWQRLVAGAGFCARPIRIVGRTTAVTSNGRRAVVYSTGGEPDGALLIRCGNRRAAVCPPCSRTYAGDVWHLLHAGVAGGSKGVPESVGGHPMWFVTLTGPGFGAVHGERCGRGREGRSASGGRTGRALVICVHGRTDRCDLVHGVDDLHLGEPVCPECYDYPAAVAFNWHAPELWRRFTIALRRGLAAQLGIPESRLGDQLRVSYAKVAEFQRRGVVHFHAIVRIDGPTAGGAYSSPATRVESVDVPAAIRGAAQDVSVDGGSETRAPIRFGAQVDIRELSAHNVAVRGGEQREASGVTPTMVAGYIAKYATKAAESFGLDASIRSANAADTAGLRAHIAAMILAGEQLSAGSDYDGLQRWLHMLGFRGHFTTKSRSFSVTLGALRQARADYRTQREEERRGAVTDALATRRTSCTDAATRRAVPSFAAGADDGDDSTVLVGNWRFLGIGHLSAGDALLAARAHSEHLEHLSYAAEARPT